MSGFLEMDKEIIQNIETRTNVKFSDEQLGILQHRGGAVVLASAGSGKTTVIINLIAKRILSGEIADTSKVLCTTYSKDGSGDMEVRLSELMKKLGMNVKLPVKTLHASYFQVLRAFGIGGNVCSGAQRLMFLRKACKDNKVRLDDEDMMVLDSLVSYQINNMLSDSELVQSCAFTLEDVTECEYGEIRKAFGKYKETAGVIDFDDMQLYMYTLLCSRKDPNVLAYCHSLWEYFFVDEFQDVSKIQFEILRALVTDPSKLVVIGDDDQCVVGETLVTTEYDEVKIENIEKNTKVTSAIGRSLVDERLVTEVAKKKINETIVRIETLYGRELAVTRKHIMFARDLMGNAVDKDCDLRYTMFSGEFDWDCELSRSSLEIDSIEEVDYGVDVDKQHEKMYSALENIEGITADIGIMLVGKRYNFINAKEVEVGMIVPTYEDGEIKEDVVIKVTEEHYDGYVYDLSVAGTRNFVANGIIVHNCIYEWRGANPNIILNICGYYPIKKFILSTNYRCYGEIVREASRGIKHNRIRESKEMKPHTEGGVVKVGSVNSADLYKMSKATVEYIKELDVMGTRMGDIAILCRNNNHLSLVYNMLFREGIICKTSREIKFAQSVIVQDIKKVIEIMSNTYNRFDVGSTLWKMVPFLGIKGSKGFEEFMDATGCSFKDTLGYVLHNYMYKNVEYNKKIKIPLSADKAIGYKFGMYKKDTTDVLTEIYQCLCSDETDKAIMYGIELYRSGVDFMYNSPDSMRYLIGTVKYLKNMIKENGVDDTLKFLVASDQYEQGNLTAPGGAVTLSTMHGAKGREWRNVILFADDNISFPSFCRLYTLMEEQVDKLDLYTILDGDRRLHYVAMTRAKEELLIISDEKYASVYLLESLGVLTECEDSNDRILKCASVSKLDQWMLDDAKEKIFNASSKYYIDLEKYIEPKVKKVESIEEVFDNKESAGEATENGCEGVQLVW